jgi:hypothetical protein
MTMNPSASEWRPGIAAAPPPQIVSPPPPHPPPSSTNDNVNANANDSEIDESDPLWKLVLNTICNGDRQRAMKFLSACGEKNPLFAAKPRFREL